MLLLTDEEVGLALTQHIGLKWVRTLALIRLRQDPMRLGEIWDEGDLLRYALQLSQTEWGDLAPDLLEIADAIVPNLPETPDYLALVGQYRRFRDST